MTDVFVPHERSLPRNAQLPPRHPGALYAFSVGVVAPWVGVTAITFAAISLGIARGALDAVAELAGSKAPLGGKVLLRDNAVVQAQFGQAEAALRAARAFLYETTRGVWESVCSTGANTAEQRVLLRLASTHAASCAAQVVETVWKAAGASSIFDGAPLERRFRDAHVITQNIAVSPVNFGEAGRQFLGLDASP